MGIFRTSMLNVNHMVVFHWITIHPISPHILLFASSALTLVLAVHVEMLEEFQLMMQLNTES
jgi:hypothetical protein